ncbi:MAG: hypothetical protein GY950_27785 [bacterium]|nr:hypothetical protein [bacterium]
MKSKKFSKKLKLSKKTIANLTQYEIKFVYGGFVVTGEKPTATCLFPRCISRTGYPCALC